MQFLNTMHTAMKPSSATLTRSQTAFTLLDNNTFKAACLPIHIIVCMNICLNNQRYAKLPLAVHTHNMICNFRRKGITDLLKIWK